MGIEDKNYRRPEMNVGNYTLSTFNRMTNQQTRKSSETPINLEAEDQRNRHSAFKKEDLVNQFWNITDSMPRENQISFAASVVANRIMSQGITDENKSFVQNIGNRFSPEEIGTLKNEVLNHPSVKGKNSSEVEAFLKDFEQFIDAQKAGELEPVKKQQAGPRFRTPDEIFFQTTFNIEAVKKATLNMASAAI